MSTTSLPTQTKPAGHPTALTAARLVLAALFILVTAIAVLTLPNTFAAVQTDWQFLQIAATTGAVLPYETLVALVACIEIIVLGLLLVTAALMLLQPPHTTTLVAATTMMLLPFTLTLGSLGIPGSVSGPTGEMLDFLSRIFEAGGVLALLILAYIFPDGHFRPRWIALLPVLAMAAFLLVALFPDIGEVGWLSLLGLFVATLVAAAYRQIAGWRQSDSAKRRQTTWFLVAMITLVVSFIASYVAEASPFALLLYYLSFALFAVSLIVAAWRGAWGREGTPRERILLFGALGLWSLLAAAGSAAWVQNNRAVPVDLAALAEQETVPLILDVDMAMDDITALLYVLQHPAADLRAITVNGVAFAHCEGGVHNALGILEIAKAPEIPVACGREEAYPGGVPAPDAWRESADRLYGASVLTGGRSEDPRSAAELLIDTIHDAPGEITILAVGPLTNLAEAFALDSSLPRLIKQIVIMGGAVDVPGNVANEAEGIDNQFAEWNFFADPMAADRVMDSGVPILLIPLDATNDVPFTRGFHQRLSAQHLTKPATFTYNLFYLNPYWLDGGMYWWDTLAVAAGLDTSLLTLEDANVDVIAEPGPEFGRTVRTPNGAPVLLATAADAGRFESMLLTLLNQP